MTFKKIWNTFSDPLARHDIALLRLQAPLVYSKNVQPIKLPSENFEAIGQSGVIIGYGTLGSSQPSNNFNLMKADSKVLALSGKKYKAPIYKLQFKLGVKITHIFIKFKCLR